MIRTTLLAASLAAVALPAAAQSTFERLEAVAVTMNGMMFDAMIAETPALEGNMPSAEWSDGLRAAYQCMYDGFVARVGEPAMAEMVTQMEAQLDTLTAEEVLMGGGDIENPEGLTDDQAAEIVSTCGMMDAFMAHMSSTGALQILMQDGLMAHQAAGEPSAYASAPAYEDGRLSAPAALRNRDDLTAALAQIAPTSGRALEIASGTGQHVIRFAPALPGLHWQPTDPDPVRRASIAAWMAAEPASNIAAPMDLDACTPGWAAHHTPYDLITLANLLHLVTEDAARTCLTEMALALRPGGRAVVYGPFLRDGKTTSDGDAAFDARLREENPGAGYKDVAWVLAQWQNAGLVPATPRQMPANNLLLTALKPAAPDAPDVT